MNKKSALVILDGWGIGSKDESYGIFLSKTPFFDSLIEKFPNALLKTFGKDVGLPEGQIGNSEVGHLNIGAGRVVYQDLLRINNAIENQTFYTNAQLLKSIEVAKRNQCPIHLMGLVSQWGVHSSLNHLLSLCTFFKKNFDGTVYIHGFTDGRDCSPHSAVSSFNILEEKIQNSKIKIASII